MIFFALSGPHWWKTLHCFWLVMKILCISGDKTLLEDPNLRSQRLLTNLTNKSLWIGLLHAATPWCRSCLGHNWRVGTAVRVTMVNYPLSKYILRKFSTDDSGPLTLSDAGVWRLYLVLLCKPTLRGEAVWDSIGQRWAHWAESHELCSPAQGHKRHRSLQGIDHHILLDKDLQAFNPI